VTSGYFIGLISGTSRDGVDAALVLFEDDQPRLLHALCLPYGEPLKSDLDELLAGSGAREAAPGSMLDDLLGRHFARAARTVAQQAGVEMRDITAIGSHGQTVWHEPGGNPPRSLQLGSPGVIRRSTGATTIAHFRQADIEAGGQGAPLAPLLHQFLFRDPDEPRAILNLGGIANLTFLSGDNGVSGYDCGPANCLLDLWIRRNLGPEYDEEGRWAASGTVLQPLLSALLEDPYFSLAPPKSTGLEYFNERWLMRFLRDHPGDPAAVQATLLELTARTVAQALLDEAEATRRLLVCGGGVHNQQLMHRLADLLPDILIESTQRHGMHPDWVEAVLFAWLARERLLERRQHTGPITGAKQPVLLGRIYPRQESWEASP
jgi:anhydro-N-acetylmuramic acid kinase